MAWSLLLVASRARIGTATVGASTPAPSLEPDKPLEHIPVPKLPKQPRGGAGGRESDPGGIGDFLNSRQGKAIQREVIRGVFGMLRKRL